MKHIKSVHSIFFLFLICLGSMVTYSQDSISVRTPNLSPNFKSIVLNPNFTHDNWETKPVDIKYEFAAYTVSFDSEDSTLDGAGKIAWGIPEWVAFEIKKGASKIGCSRPSPWLTDITLNEDKIAPKDGTYKVSGTNNLKIVSGDYRYVRGHLAPFATASRINCDAAWNTCTTLNAVPQLQWQNNGIWKNLEKKCTDWADKHQKVWVVCGPVFFDKEPSVWIGQKDEVRAAVPDALFKIVIRESNNDTGVETIAFIIPNVVPKNKELKEFVTSIDQIESLTNVSFLHSLTVQQQSLEKLKHGIPPLPSDYSNMTTSEKRRARDERKRKFHKSNRKLIKSWLE